MNDSQKIPKKTVRHVVTREASARGLERGQAWSESLVVKLAEEAWRLEQRINRVEAAGRFDEASLRTLRDSAKRMNDALLEREVEALDHTGQQFNQGMQVEVLDARGEGPGLVIVETIRPTIVHQRHVLRQGQVVVGPRAELEKEE